MVQFKDKKKKQKKRKKRQLKTTLNHRHSETISILNKNLNNLPELKKNLKSLNKKLNEILLHKNIELSEKELEDKLILKEQIKEITNSIKILETGKNKEEYLLNTSHMLFHYFDDNETYTSNQNNSPIKSKKNKTVLDFFSKNIPKKEKAKKNIDKDVKIKFKSKKAIMNAYLSIIDKDFVPKMKNISNEELDLCKTCNEQRIYDATGGILICPKCGCEEKILIDNDTPSYKEPPREITYFAYKKINHANEFLSQFQAKESTDIDNKIFDKILEELKKESYINIKNITPNKVREILKKLELTKYYEHCHYITNRLTGKPAPTLDSELEEKLRNMFKEVQGPWMKYCPNDRANFFSYPYIFFKFFQLLDKDEYLPYCRLLKSREKLQEHDEVWKKICRDLRWEFIPTV